MKTILSILALLLLSGNAQAGTTNIAQVPLLNITGSGSIKPNLMLLFDNSGSMNWNYTPDYIADNTTCRAGALMSNGQLACSIGHPPFSSPDFNKQYYNPKVSYRPPVKSDGTSYNSLNAANTSNWTAVTTDGYGVNMIDLTNSNASSTSLVTGFPDYKWCNSSNVCVVNSATYAYPDQTYASPKRISTNAYYYTIDVAEYCTDASMTTCQTTVVGAPAPAGYPIPARVRWCNSSALTTCQAKYLGAYKYPRYSSPNSGVIAAYGTITINASSGSNSVDISSVTVAESGGPVVITSGTVNAPTGTNSATKQATMATSLAASIIARTGLSNQYTACVKTPTPAGSVPDCAVKYGITLGAGNMVAVIPINCAAGVTNKASCSVLPHGARDGWALTAATPVATVTPAQPATAILSISGATTSQGNATLSGLSLGGTSLFPSTPASATTAVFSASTSAATMASALRTKIGTVGTITAYLGGTSGVSLACSSASTSSVCLVNTAAGAGGQTIGVGTLSPNGGATGNATAGNIVFGTTASSSAAPAVTDTIPVTTSPLGAGNSVFVRVDIVPSRTSYPKDPNRIDCAGTACTYAEEMTNFANWYGYYKIRMQMMKSAVGQAFQPLTANYKVGLVSLSVAAVEGTMKYLPKPFSGTDRDAWYTALYAMSTSGATPMRQALHAVGKMYAGLAPYANNGVVQYPCQQNFTFITTDGYWNGGAAATVTNNDNAINPARFCSQTKGCYDPANQSANSLADVALYWYNGGSNGTGGSLNTGLEDWTKPGLVPAGAGENTRLHMNTYALGLGVDGVMNYEENYDTTPIVGGDFYKLITGATTGCPWNNKGAYVWPDPATSDSNGGASYQSRVDDLWHAAINGHGKYFSASDPLQVVGGLQAALSNIQVRVGAAAAAATSTPNISQQDNDIFSDTFTTVKWYGELSDKKIDTVTGIVGTSAVWISSDRLGQAVSNASDTRVLRMSDGAGGLKDFRYSAMSALERGWFDNKCSALAQCSNLSSSDRLIVNAGANLVDWLRGQQQYADDSLFRAYTKTDHNPPGLSAPIPIVLGDIASSKPAYLREPRKNYALAGYSDFKVDRTANRSAAVFAAANDGMLHAFNAKSGDEMWAYVPRITMKKLAVQASTTYGTNHQFTADGSPEVADIQIGGFWKTVLVAGLNGGGRGYYALDVTDSTTPVALWELCADPAICAGSFNDPDLGLTFGNPQFGMFNGQWVVFLTSGYNNVPGTDGVNSGDGRGYLYIVDVATGKVIQKIGTGSGSTTTPSGFAKITSVSTNPLTDPVMTQIYGGDNLGQMWRFDLTKAPTVTQSLMGNAGTLQPITTRPEVTSCQVDTAAGDGTVTSAAKVVVAFGTGRLLDVPDVSNTDVQSVYVIKDAGTELTPWRATSTMEKQTLSLTSSGGGVNTYTISGLPVNLSTKSGWYVDFNLNGGERVNLDPKVVAGGLNVVTNLPSSSSACSVGGSSNVYQFNVCTGSYLDATKVVGSTLSATSAAVGFIIIRLPSGVLKMVTTTADGNTLTSGVTPATSRGASKVGWRRIKNN